MRRCPAGGRVAYLLTARLNERGREMFPIRLLVG